MDTNSNTTQLLQAILNEVSSSMQLLGFGHPPKPRYIYTNRQYADCLWYFWNAAKNEHEPMFESRGDIIPRPSHLIIVDASIT